MLTGAYDGAKAGEAYDDKENAASRVWRSVKSRRKVPADVVQQGTDDQVREL